MISYLGAHVSYVIITALFLVLCVIGCVLKNLILKKMKIKESLKAEKKKEE